LGRELKVRSTSLARELAAKEKGREEEGGVGGTQNRRERERGKDDGRTTGGH
jgi:hypothetical protein